jgi:ferrous iron transport protein B
MGFTIFSVVYLTVLGWIVSTLFYQLTVGRQVLWIAIPLSLIAVIFGVLHTLGKRDYTDKTMQHVR